MLPIGRAALQRVAHPIQRILKHGLRYALKHIPEDWLKEGDTTHEPEKMSQNHKILLHLNDVGSISWVEANDLYRVRSLLAALLTCVKPVTTS